MPVTYTDEVNIYNPNAIQEGIDEAGTTASAYITEVSADNGIVVAPVGKGTVNKAIASSTTGWHLADVLEYIRNGVSRFWIGLKNAGDSTPTVRIGKKFVNGASDNESHMELDYHSLQLVDKEGNTYFHVSDLREADGLAKLSDRFIVGGQDATYYAPSTQYPTGRIVVYVSFVPSSEKQPTAKVDGVSATSVSIFAGTTTVTVIPASSPVENGAEVVVTYYTANGNAKALTFGTRSSTGNIGGKSSVFGYGVAAGKYSFAEGYNTKATGSQAHAEGRDTVASNSSAHAEGGGTEASGFCSHAEGDDTKAIGTSSHAEGYGAKASNQFSHAEGSDTEASGEASHAEGYGMASAGNGGIASGIASHVEGYMSFADGYASHAQNSGTKASGDNQTALGKYNVEDASGTNAVIVGNGTSDTARSNALAVDWDGDVTMGHQLDLTADSNNFAALTFASENRTGDFIKLYGNGTDGYGDAVVIGDGGAVVIGAGESADALYTAESMVPGTENTHIAADVDVHLWSNCNTIANRRRATLNSAGEFVLAPRNYDLKSATNGISANFWPAIQIHDSNSLRSSLIGSAIRTGGAVGTGLWAYNYDTSGTQVGTGALGVYVDKSGNVTYEFSKQPMREAVGVAAFGRLTGMSGNQTLTTSYAKVAFTTFAGSGCSASANGIKVTRAGTYMIWATAYMTTDYTDNDIIHFAIYKNSTNMYSNQERTTNAAPYKTVHVGPTIFDLAAGDVVYLYAYNQASARGVIGNMAMNGLYLRQIA